MFQWNTTQSQPVLPPVTVEYPAGEISPALLPEAVTDRREDYLDRVMAPLTPLLPFERRQEMRRELRQHLDAMLHAYLELGELPEVAVEKAFTQFGKPEEFAESLKKSAVYPSHWQRMRAWWSQPRLSLAGVLPVLLLASAVYVGLTPMVSRPAASVQQAQRAESSITNTAIVTSGVFSHKAVVNQPCNACHRVGPVVRQEAFDRWDIMRREALRRQAINRFDGAAQ